MELQEVGGFHDDVDYALLSFRGERGSREDREQGKQSVCIPVSYALKYHQEATLRHQQSHDLTVRLRRCGGILLFSSYPFLGYYSIRYALWSYSLSVSRDAACYWITGTAHERQLHQNTRFGGCK
jgi:hypothetical protein